MELRQDQDVCSTTIPHIQEQQHQAWIVAAKPQPSVAGVRVHSRLQAAVITKNQCLRHSDAENLCRY